MNYLALDVHTVKWSQTKSYKGRDEIFNKRALMLKEGSYSQVLSTQKLS